jgi:hypothetical protein
MTGKIRTKSIPAIHLSEPQLYDEPEEFHQPFSCSNL